MIQKNWSALQQKQCVSSGILLKFSCSGTFLRPLNPIYCETCILQKSPSKIHFRFKMPCIKKIGQQLSQAIRNTNQEKPKPITSGEGAWRKKEEWFPGLAEHPSWTSAFSPASSPPLLHFLRMLTVRGLFAGTCVCVEERERGRWESGVTVVSENLKLKQKGGRGPVCSHGRSQNAAFFSEQSQQKQLLMPHEGYLCQPGHQHQCIWYFWPTRNLLI